MGVADDGIGDATQHRSPYTAKASATYNNQTSPYLLCQSSNLRVRPSYSEMTLCDTASSGFDLPYQAVYRLWCPVARLVGTRLSTGWS